MEKSETKAPPSSSLLLLPPPHSSSSLSTTTGLGDVVNDKLAPAFATSPTPVVPDEA
jgi:hypothetical protein